MTAQTNPLVSQIRQKVAKTVTVALPTQGQFYHEGVLAPGTDVNLIEVNPLTVEAELILKDTILMAAGRAIPKMVAHLVPQVLVPEELSDIDIEVLLLAIRIASYGSDLKLEHICQNPEQKNGKLSCGKTNTLNINLIDHIQKYAPITNWDPYQIRFDLGDNQSQIVYLRRMPYRSVLTGVRNSLMAETEMEAFRDKDFNQMVLSDDILAAYEKVTELVTSTNLDSLLDCVIGVEMINGEERAIFYTTQRPEMIKEWLWSIPRDWVTQLNKRVQESIQELGKLNTNKYTCPNCNFENSFQMQLDVNKLFFSEPPSSSPPEKPLETSSEKTKSRPRPRSRTSSR